MTDIREPRTGAQVGAGADLRQLVAMFEDYAKALSAREALEAAGVPRSRLEILDQSSSGAAYPPTESGAEVRRTEETGYVRRAEDRPADEGVWESIKRFFMPDEDAHVYAEGVRRGYAVLIARVDAADQDRVLALLEAQDPVNVETHTADWRREGWSGFAPGYAESESGIRETPVEPATGAEFRAPPTAGPAGAAGEQEIPVYEERLRVGKRETGRGSVRVRSFVVEEPVEEDVTLHEDRVQVERVPVDRAATERDITDQPFRERTVEVTARSEEPVVSKEARVKEEVRVRKEPVERVETVRDSVRHTEVEVDDERPGRTTAPREPNRR